MDPITTPIPRHLPPHPPIAHKGRFLVENGCVVVTVGHTPMIDSSFTKMQKHSCQQVENEWPFPLLRPSIPAGTRIQVLRSTACVTVNCGGHLCAAGHVRRLGWDQTAPYIPRKRSAFFLFRFRAVHYGNPEGSPPAAGGWPGDKWADGM